jgi:hypothetical protein
MQKEMVSRCPYRLSRLCEHDTILQSRMRKAWVDAVAVARVVSSWPSSSVGSNWLALPPDCGGASGPAARAASSVACTARAFQVAAAAAAVAARVTVASSLAFPAAVTVATGAAVSALLCRPAGGSDRRRRRLVRRQWSRNTHEVHTKVVPSRSRRHGVVTLVPTGRPRRPTAAGPGGASLAAGGVGRSKATESRPRSYRDNPGPAVTTDSE